MSAKSQIVGAGINSYLNLRRSKYALHTVGRLLRGGKRRIAFYYRADDPYSHLLAQVMPRLATIYQLDVDVIPVAEASLAAHPAPDMLAQHAMRDAALLAESYGLSFAPRSELPPEDRIRRAHAVLLRDRPSAEQLEVAQRVGEVVWRDDGSALASLVDRYGAVSGELVRPLLERNYERLQRAGHYQSGMVHYGGEWYWGLDRLPYLERRLQQEGLDGDTKLAAGRAPSLTVMLGATNGTPRLQVFFSFRSPYSYLSLPQLRDMRDRGLIDLELRPVLPMVMRGLPVPRTKRLYIVRDAKREADRLGIPFGRISDPLGKGIEYCFAVFYHCAVPKGLELEFALSALRGSWSEARDIASIPDLLFLAERVGIGEAEVREALSDDGWKEKAKANRETLTDLGLWGVPSVHIGSYSTWGQDRVPLIRAALAGS
ncbi:MAG: DsbA family protein [Deltaproteobacteria bacterium]|nr:DsbA family protein [Deltaproteobacteria bacterium]